MEQSQVNRIIAVRELMKERENARKDKNFDMSDQLRTKLQETYGVKVIDQNNGPSGWRFIDGSANKIHPGLMPLKVNPNVMTWEDVKIEERKKRKIAGENLDNSNPSQSTSQVPNLLKKPKAELLLNQNNKKQSLENQISQLPKRTNPEIERNKKALGSVVQTPSNQKVVQGILIEELIEGSGATAQSGNRLKMHYVGKLKSNNKVFDSSVGKRPFVFKLGKGEVIKGWDIGCLGMKVNGKRRLTIPPEKGYGRQGAPPTIPGNASLIFDITLLEVI